MKSDNKINIILTNESFEKGFSKLNKDGIKLSHFKINYGRSTYHLHGSPNYFSFSTDFSKFYKQQ